MVKNTSDHSFDLTVENNAWYLAVQIDIHVSHLTYHLSQSTDLDVSLHSYGNVDRLVIGCIFDRLLDFIDIRRVIVILLREHEVIIWGIDSL